MRGGPGARGAHVEGRGCTSGRGESRGARVAHARGPSASPSARLPASGPILSSASRRSAKRRTGRSAARCRSRSRANASAGWTSRRRASRSPTPRAARTTADVRSDVRRAYFMAVAAVRRIEVAQELETIATRARDAAQERFQAGAAPRLEALQSQLALVAGAERRRGRARRA